MQIQHRYLVKNKTTIVLNEAGFITEYKPVYQRQLQVFKGIDNTLEFKLVNADQKPVRITTDIPKLIAFDENQNQVLDKTGTVLDDGTSLETKGLFKVVIAANDTLNLKEQFLTYSIYIEDSVTNLTTLTYNDVAFGACAAMKVSACVFPGPSVSHPVTTFIEDNGIWRSSTLGAEPGINGNEALHTAAVYTSGYIGSLVVQSTLDNAVDGDSTVDWSDITTLTFDGTETTPTPVNFNGVYSYLRFKATSNPADKITKILVRN
tara:strand:+ start:521 stop:1309 length:789 start_codon:yes stop_codon:yes gene_type:complete